MRIAEISISREQLLKMPIGERNIFLQSCHIANELNVLGKVLLCTYFKGTPVETEAQLSMLLTLTRTCVSKAWEGWKFVRTTMLTKKGTPRTDLRLSAETMNELGRLKDAFESDQVFKFLRNKVSFHYDPVQMGVELEHLPEDFRSKIYVGDKAAYCLYLVPEEILLHHIAKVTNATTLQEGLDILGRGLGETLGPLTMVIGQGLMLLAHRYLANETGKIDAVPVEVVLRSIHELRIPYFGERRNFPEAAGS